jgi:hypothetical protein
MQIILYNLQFHDRYYININWLLNNFYKYSNFDQLIFVYVIYPRTLISTYVIIL